MRTKALLLGAAIGAVGLATSMAQVYSVNIVGYVNVPVPTGWSIIANPLKASPDNTVLTLLGTPTGGDLALYKWDTTSQQYNESDWSSVFQFWTDETFTMDPGTGIYIYNAGSPFTVTFVGEVMTGTQNVPLKPGWNLVASVIPQTGLLQTDLLYPPSPGENAMDGVYMFDNASGQYFTYNWAPAFFGGWDEEPTLHVGEGAYIFRSATADAQWTRTFNVGP